MVTSLATFATISLEGISATPLAVLGSLFSPFLIGLLSKNNSISRSEIEKVDDELRTSIAWMIENKQDISSKLTGQELIDFERNYNIVKAQIDKIFIAGNGRTQLQNIQQGWIYSPAKNQWFQKQQGDSGFFLNVRDYGTFGNSQAIGSAIEGDPNAFFKALADIGLISLMQFANTNLGNFRAWITTTRGTPSTNGSAIDDLIKKAPVILGTINITLDPTKTPLQAIDKAKEEYNTNKLNGAIAVVIPAPTGTIPLNEILEQLMGGDEETLRRLKGLLGAQAFNYLMNILKSITNATSRTKTREEKEKKKKRKKRRETKKNQRKPKQPDMFRFATIDVSKRSKWIAKMSFTFPMKKPIDSDDRGTLTFTLKRKGKQIIFHRVKRGTFSAITQYYGTGYRLWAQFWKHKIVNRWKLSWFIKRIDAEQRKIGIQEELNDPKVKRR